MLGQAPETSLPIGRPPARSEKSATCHLVKARADSGDGSSRVRDPDAQGRNGRAPTPAPMGRAFQPSPRRPPPLLLFQNRGASMRSEPPSAPVHSIDPPD